MKFFLDKVRELPIWKKVNENGMEIQFQQDGEVMFAILYSILQNDCDTKEENELERKYLRGWAESFSIDKHRRQELIRLIDYTQWDAMEFIAETGAEAFIDSFIKLCLLDRKISLEEYRLLYILGKYLNISNKQISALLDQRVSSTRYRAILFFDNPMVSVVVSLLIILNAIQLGLSTCDWFIPYSGEWLYFLDLFFVFIFSLEILSRIFAFRKDFFKEPQNIFDFIIVAVSWFPCTGFLWIKSFRIFRALLLLNRLKQLKMIVLSMLNALPNIGWVSFLLAIFFYVFAVVLTNLFGTEFVAFESIGNSLFSLFQLMTLEGWPDLVSSVMEKYPYAWMVFIPFILITSYVILNLIVGIVVTAIQDMSLKKNTAILREFEAISEMKNDLQALIMQVNNLQNTISQMNQKTSHIQQNNTSPKNCDQDDKE